jgi:hypothetical protein
VGTWGTGIFDDDTAADARDQWVQLLKDGVAPKEATKTVFGIYSDDDPVVVLALAATQWTWGRIDQGVKKRALQMIRDRSALRDWSDARARELKLRALEEKLQSTPPAPRAIRIVTAPKDWAPGEILAWKVMDGRRALMRVVETDATYGKAPGPKCELLDWYGAKLPTTREIRKLGLRSTTQPDERLDAALRRHPFFSLGFFEHGEYPHRKLKRLHVQTEVSRSGPYPSLGVHWNDFDDFLARRFDIGWTSGSILALRTERGTLFLFLVLRVIWTPYHNLEVVLRVLDWRSRTLPTSEALPKIRYLPSRKYPDWPMGIIALGPPQHIERVGVIGRREIPADETGQGGGLALDWDRIESRLASGATDL